MDLNERAMMTASCRDADSIPKVADAGAVVAAEAGPAQIMHNGLRVMAGAYHGDWMTGIIHQLRGHHAPQKELLFHALIALCRSDTLCVELGAFWSYYTLWYLCAISGATGLCVEPDPAHLEIGRGNAALNDLGGRVRFVNARAGGRASPARLDRVDSADEPLSPPVIDMGALLALCDGRGIEILLVDASGAELDFLQSMRGAAARPRFLVVSTHHASVSGSSTTHRECVDVVRSLGGFVLAEHAPEESFNAEGLVVAGFDPADAALRLPEISRNKPEHSLYPPAGKFISYAQNAEDVLLFRALKGVARGFYIDIGANDPNIDSVSKAFHERGWRGVHVEPSHDFAEKLRAERPGDEVLEIAVGNGAALVEFHEVTDVRGWGTADSGTVDRHVHAGHETAATKVLCLPLAALLDKYGDGPIHWMKIDVEGMERSVLESWSPSRVRPWIVAVESTYPNSQVDSSFEWRGLLTALGYQHVYFDGLNRYFLHEDHPELQAAFDHGACLFDDFITREEAWLKQEWRNTQSVISAARAAAEAQCAQAIDQIKSVEMDAARARAAADAQCAQAIDQIKLVEMEAAKARAEREQAERELEQARRERGQERVAAASQYAEAMARLRDLELRLASIRSSRVYRLFRFLMR